MHQRHRHHGWSLPCLVWSGVVGSALGTKKPADHPPSRCMFQDCGRDAGVAAPVSTRGCWAASGSGPVWGAMHDSAAGCFAAWTRRVMDDAVGLRSPTASD